MLTRYAKEMNRELPHGYHPTPQLKRERYIILNGEWDFSLDSDAICSEYKEKILVPFCPESELSGIKRSVLPGDLMHYRRSFAIPDEWKTGKTILHFGAVDETAEVYINGERVGSHAGGYTPFSFDITDKLKDGENELRVEAKDGLEAKYPHGKQRYKRGGMWYTPVSGIWQTVWLENVPSTYIEGIRITPSESGIDIDIDGGAYEKKLTLTDSGDVFSFSGEHLHIDADGLEKWTPEKPHLYYFTVEAGEDRLESYFAYRWVDVRPFGERERLCLNGEPYLFNGLLDQGYYPDGIYTPATEDAYLDDILTAKKLGFNMLRKHIKTEPMIFYHLCDKHGMAVFQDMVNNGKYSFIKDTALPTVLFSWQRLHDRYLSRDAETRRIFEDTMYETADLVYNSPSVVYYTIFNEGWGQFEADKMYERLSAYDGTRIIDTTSGWFRRRSSNVDSRHIYFRRLSPKKLDKRPLVISEFGGYAHVVDGHIFNTENQYGYRTISDRRDYCDAVTALYENEVAPLVANGASALVYTQLSDVEDEVNGLLTYDREVLKLDAERMAKINSELSKLSKL